MNELKMLVATRSDTGLVDSGVLRHLAYARVRSTVWHADQDLPPPQAEQARVLVLLHDLVGLGAAQEQRLVQLLRSFWQRRLTMALFDGSARWLAVAGLVPADVPMQAEGVFTHMGPADVGALAELFDAVADAPHALR